MIEIQKCVEIKHGCPRQTDADCKELMNVNTCWAGVKKYAVDLYLTCKLFKKKFPENSRHIRQIVTDENVQK